MSSPCFNLLQLFLPKLIVMYALGCSGLSLYVSKIPERLFPGVSLGLSLCLVNINYYDICSDYCFLFGKIVYT